MRRDIHTKNEKIAALENALEAQQTQYETDILAVRQKLEDNTAENRLEMQHMEANFQDQIDSLTQKLKVRLRRSITSQAPRCCGHGIAAVS